MKSYSLAPQTIRRLLRRSFARFQAAVTLILLILGGYLLSDGPVRGWLGSLIFVVVLLAYAAILITHYRRERRYLRALRVDLTRKDLILYQTGQHVERVALAEVWAVQETREGLYVSSYDDETLTVPFGLEADGDEQVRATLSDWAWIQPIPAYSYLSDIPLVIGLLVSMTVLVFVNSLWSVLPVGGAMLVYYVVVYLRVRWLEKVNPGVLRSYVMALSFLLFIIVLKTCVLIPLAWM